MMNVLCQMNAIKHTSTATNLPTEVPSKWKETSWLVQADTCPTVFGEESLWSQKERGTHSFRTGSSAKQLTPSLLLSPPEPLLHASVELGPNQHSIQMLLPPGLTHHGLQGGVQTNLLLNVTQIHCKEMHPTGLSWSECCWILRSS